MTSSPQGSPTAKRGGDKNAPMSSTAKGILIMVLLLVLAGAGGYFFGIMQQVAPVRKVAPGTPGAFEIATTPAGNTVVPGGKLKKSYWLHSKGNEQVGYAIAISVNGNAVGMIQSPDRTIDITRHLNPGNNKILFHATSLPASQRSAARNWHELTIEVMTGDKLGDTYANAETLMQYTRKVTDTQDYNDDMPLMIVEG